MRDVLDMPSVTFFVLLEEGYRGYYRHMQLLANVSSVAYMEKGDRKRFMDQLDMAGKEPRDIFNTDNLDDYSGLEIFKSMMG